MDEWLIPRILFSGDLFLDQDACLLDKPSIFLDHLLINLLAHQFVQSFQPAKNLREEMVLGLILNFKVQ